MDIFIHIPLGATTPLSPDSWIALAGVLIALAAFIFDVVKHRQESKKEEDTEK